MSSFLRIPLIDTAKIRTIFVKSKLLSGNLSLSHFFRTFAKAIVSTTVFKTKGESCKKTLRQQAYMKESLERAFDEMKQARREGRKLQSADDFIKELSM